MSDCRQLEFRVLQGKALLCQFACFFSSGAWCQKLHFGSIMFYVGVKILLF